MAATGTRKKSTKRRSQTRSKKKKQTEFRNEVILWTVLAISIILFVSNFGFGGVVGGKLSMFFFGVFGLIAYIFPICLFVGSAFIISNQSNKKKKVANIISDETIEYVGILAKLELSEEEKEQAKKDMGSMLDYIDKLGELDTSGVEPMSHVFPVKNVFREDVVTNGDMREDILKNAPGEKDGMFVVPRTFE